MGITSHLDAYPAEGLGGLRIGVSPLEMARAYATIDNGGWRIQADRDHEGRLPRRHGRPSLGKPKRKKVFTDGADLRGDAVAMEANVAARHRHRAPARLPDRRQDRHDDNFTDAWFVGFTPS